MPYFHLQLQIQTLSYRFKAWDRHLLSTVQQLLITSAHGGITYVDLLKATFYHDEVLQTCL